MESFLGIPTKKILTINNNYINPSEPFNFKRFSSTLYYCYNNNIPCIVSQKNDISLKNTPGVYVINNCHELYFSWNYIISMNKFFLKYTIKDLFCINNTNFYHIFLINLIYNNRKLFKNNGVSLLGNRDSIVGIYDTFNNSITNCNNYLYFSYFVQKFIFYKVFSDKRIICGKLMKSFEIVDDTIIYKNEKPIMVPKSLTKIKNKIYSIDKRNIKIISKCSIHPKIKNKVYYDLLNMNNMRTLFLVNSKYNFTPAILNKFYAFLVARFPILDDPKIKILINPKSININPCHLVLILLTNKGQNKLVIDINQYFINYIEYIYYSIGDFFEEIKKTSELVIEPIILNYNKDLCVHIVSEVLYIWLILKYLWLIQKNVKISTNKVYIQANYSFSKAEIAIFKSYNNNKDDFSEYLKCLISSVLGTFLDNYYLFISDSDYLDLIPIYDGIDISTAQNYISYSRKANYSKRFLIGTLSNFCSVLKKNVDIPVIFLNITKIHNLSKLNLYKMYGNTNTKSYPIIINVAYNSNKLLINLSYKKNIVK